MILGRNNFKLNKLSYRENFRILKFKFSEIVILLLLFFPFNTYGQIYHQHHSLNQVPNENLPAFNGDQANHKSLGKTEPSDRMHSYREVPSDGMHSHREVPSDGKHSHMEMSSDGIHPHREVPSEVIHPHRRVPSDRIQSGSEVLSDEIQSGSEVPRDGTYPQREVASDGIQSSREVPSDGIQSEIEVSSDGMYPHREVTNNRIQSSIEVSSDGIQSENEVPSDGVYPHREESSDGIKSSREVPSDGMYPHREVTSDGTQSSMEVSTDGTQSSKEEPNDGIQSGRKVPTEAPSDKMRPHREESSDGMYPQREVPSDGIQSGREVPSDGIQPGKKVPSDGMNPHTEVPSDGIQPGKKVPSDGMNPHIEVPSDGIHPSLENASVFDLKDKNNKKRSTNGYDRYPQAYNTEDQMENYNHHHHHHDQHRDFHVPQNDLHRPQSDHLPPMDFHFGDEGRNPKMDRQNNVPYSSNSMMARREKPHFHPDENFDAHHKMGPKENYNFLSKNFIDRNKGSDSTISSSNQDKENEFDFPDKIVKDGQVFYRHGANHHTEHEIHDKEQADGSFQILKEMSHENTASNNDNLSKGFDLLLNQVRQAQESSPSISAAIAGAAIRGSSKGSFSHVIGTAINGGYFAASAKGYDDKGGSIHSHIHGTGNGASGGASAIAPGREGDAFIQVDNSDNGLSIGQSSTHNGEAFVIADVDKDSHNHYEMGDSTSSFTNKYKNDSNGYSFGEAKSNLYSTDESRNNGDSFKNKNSRKYNSDLNKDIQKETSGMGLVDNIMEKVHQPHADGYFKDFPKVNDHTLKTRPSPFENYPKINLDDPSTVSNAQTPSQPKDKGVVGLVTFPFNTIGSPPGPGELLTQAPDTRNKENFENHFEELPYYDMNTIENNENYYTDNDSKLKGNNGNFKNFDRNQNWPYSSETSISPNEPNLSNSGPDKIRTEQSYDEEPLVYQPYSSVLIDSYNNRHLLPQTLNPKNNHEGPESWKTSTYPIISEDTTNYKMRNSQPVLQKPQVSTEVPLETDLHSKNLVTPVYHSSFNFSTDRNHDTNDSKYFTAYQQMVGNENSFDRETLDTNYHLNNPNQKGIYDQGPQFSYQDPQAHHIPHEYNYDSNNPHEHTSIPLYNQNNAKNSYNKDWPISNKDQQIHATPSMNEIVTQTPRYHRTTIKPKTILAEKLGSSGTIITTTERTQVITPGKAGDVQHLKASEPGLPTIRVVTMDNNDRRKQFYQREGTSIGPGEKIPGVPGYRVPPGFRGRVVYGHQLPVNFESKKAIPGYNTRVNLTPQRPYAGPVFASVSGPQAASKFNHYFGEGVHITLSSPTMTFSNLKQGRHGTPSYIRENDFSPHGTPSYIRKEDLNQPGMPSQFRKEDFNQQGTSSYTSKENLNRQRIPSYTSEKDLNQQGMPSQFRKKNFNQQGKPSYNWKEGFNPQSTFSYGRKDFNQHGTLSYTRKKDFSQQGVPSQFKKEDFNQKDMHSHIRKRDLNQYAIPTHIRKEDSNQEGTPTQFKKEDFNQQRTPSYYKKEGFNHQGTPSHIRKEDFNQQVTPSYNRKKDFNPQGTLSQFRRKDLNQQGTPSYMKDEEFNQHRRPSDMRYEGLNKQRRPSDTRNGGFNKQGMHTYMNDEDFNQQGRPLDMRDEGFNKQGRPSYMNDKNFDQRRTPSYTRKKRS